MATSVAQTSPEVAMDDSASARAGTRRIEMARAMRKSVWPWEARQRIGGGIVGTYASPNRSGIELKMRRLSRESEFAKVLRDVLVGAIYQVGKM